MEQTRPWRYRPVFPRAVYPMDRTARYTRAVTSFNLEEWLPTSGLEGYSPLLWLRADQGVSTGGARQFYSTDKGGLQSSSSALLLGNVDWTIGAWIYCDTTTAVMGIVSTYPATGGAPGVEFYVNVDNTIGAGIRSAGGVLVASVTSTETVTDGRWAFVDLEHDATNDTLKIRINNGSAATSASYSGTPAAGTLFSLGIYTGLNYALNGRMSRAILSSRKWTSAERTWLYNLGRGRIYGELGVAATDGSDLLTSLQAYWNLNETSGTANAVDQHSTNDLTPTFGELITNGGFSADTNWSKGGGCTIAAGVASWDGSQNPANSQTYQAAGTSGHRYSFTFTVTGRSAGGIGVFNGGSTFGTTRTADGTYVETLTASGGNTGLIANATYVGSADNFSLVALDIPACDGPSSDIASDSIGTNHGLLTGFADSETAWSSDTADGTPQPTVLNAVDSTTYPGLMVGFSNPTTARSAHGLTNVPGKAITFDGTDDKTVTLYSVSGTGDFTACLWVKATAIDATNGNFLLGNYAAANSGGFEISINATGQISFYLTSSLSGVTTLSLNTWYHVSVVRSSGNVTIYVNGVSDVTASKPASITDVGNKLCIGNGADYNTEAHTGQIADPRVYSTALTAIQIAAIAAGDSGLTGTPVLRYTFDEPVRDLATIGAGYSLSLDGVDDYVRISSAITTGTTFTISAWSKNAASGAYRDIFTSNYNGNGFYYDGGTGKLNYYFLAADHFSSVGLNANAWNHCVISVSSGTGTFYINGVAAGTVSSVPTLNLQTIGYFNTALDDVRIYSTALSAAQVLQLSQGSEATGATPTAHWPLDDGTQISVVDGDPIAVWESLEGSRHRFIQATASKRPVYVESAIGGQPGIDGDGIDDILIKASAFLTGTTGTVVIVVRLDSIQNTEIALSSSDEATSNKQLTFSMLESTGNRKLNYYWCNGATADDLRGDSVMAIDTDYAVLIGSSDTLIRLRRNGVTQSLTVASGGNSGNWWTDATGKDNVTLFGVKSTSENSFLSGKIAEVQVWPHDFGAESIAKEVAYILARYGIAF